MLALKTLNDVFFTLAAGNRADAMVWLDASGQWRPISAAQVYQRVRAVAESLTAWGLVKGDRVAILSENRWEWAVADFACLALGVIDVPIYPTLTPEQIGVLLADSGTRVIFVSTKAQYEKIAKARQDMAAAGTRMALERIVMMDEAGTPDAVHFSSLVEGADARGAERDADFDRAAYDVKPGDLATLIYTSGTTGEPKGVMLTHGNIACNLNYSTAEFGFTMQDSCISFLPLSHVTARHLDYALFAQHAAVAYCSTIDKLPGAFAAIRPTILVAVPRVYEKVRQEAERRAAAQSPTKARIFAWALKTGKKHRDTIGAGDEPSSIGWKLANKLVYSKIRAGFGGRVRYFIAGGAPLGMDTAGWFADAGMRILEGYGLTETSPVVALNTPKAYRIGSVGRLLPNVECRVAEDGELLLRGPSIFRGYWQQAAATAESFDAEGWFRTGDIGHIDADGFLYITDRKKELIKTSGGKFIAPAPIENRLKSSYLVAQAALVGDKHKFASVLIAPNFPALEGWAKERGIAAATRRDLVADPQVVAEYEALIDRINASLANFETIKRFRLVPDEWTIDSGELTPSLKLKRRVVNEKYAAEIAAFYAENGASQS
ncbi:AMP-dependent synthetase/ligase [Paracidobacterium acidisoli]|uniref:Long-chain fatty acid--CoA ligase n=1 Tax=Paracidobacterium acidisoli TaxID=2303751 RepID=A0A372ITX5_9BACT|nr:long-chain fatty acid--CoA ligase [Paracidobacterium acidisoli]MBT9329800.1 long-chain fatty acid--CoA ligase [Paracidobacterium acidisoli]